MKCSPGTVLSMANRRLRPCTRSSTLPPRMWQHNQRRSRRFCKALAKQPGDRYQHAGDLALDIRRFRQRPVEARHAAPALQPVRRSLWIANAVLLFALPVAWWAGHRRSSAPAENPLAGAEFTRLTDFPGDETSASISPDGRFVTFVSDRDGRDDLWLGQIGTGRFRNVTMGSFFPSNRDLLQAGFSGDGSRDMAARTSFESNEPDSADGRSTASFPRRKRGERRLVA